MGWGGPWKPPNNEEYVYTLGETLVGGVEDCLSNIEEIMDSREVTDVGS